MIAPNAGLSLSRQCTLLGIARSSFYYQPRPTSADELDLLNRLDLNSFRSSVHRKHFGVWTPGARWLGLFADLEQLRVDVLRTVPTRRRPGWPRNRKDRFL